MESKEVMRIGTSPVHVAALNRNGADRGGSNHAGRDHAGPDRWEMVIPKMSRPLARSSKKLISDTPVAGRPVEKLSIGKSGPQKQLATAAPVPTVAAERSVEKELRAPEFAVMEQKTAGRRRKFVTIGAASLAALSVTGILAWSLTQDTASSKSPAPVAVIAGPALSMGPAHWIPLSESPRRISVIRDSTNLTDFRMSFAIPVSAKAAGWVFRVRDSRNYYATRLELPKSAEGLSPAVASSTGVLKRFAVIDGRDQPVTQIPVTVEIQPGALFKVRTEALGNKFTTWIADRKIDEWTDSRLGDGGVGVYKDRGEPAATVDDLAVFPLLKK